MRLVGRVKFFVSNDVTMEEYNQVRRGNHVVVHEEAYLIVGLVLGEEFAVGDSPREITLPGRKVTFLTRF